MKKMKRIKVRERKKLLLPRIRENITTISQHFPRKILGWAMGDEDKNATENLVILYYRE